MAPEPEFLFQEGGGPLFDMGPYYLTALVQLFGPVAGSAAPARRPAERVIGSGPAAGTEFPSRCRPMSARSRVRERPSSQSIFSFDSPLAAPGSSRSPGPTATSWCRTRTGSRARLDLVHGANRTSIADPAVHRYDRRPRHRRRRAGPSDPAPVCPERASGALAAHVLDVMLSIAEAAETDRFVDVASRAPQPDPLPADWDPAASTDLG